VKVAYLYVVESTRSTVPQGEMPVSEENVTCRSVRSLAGNEN
jgi:hypothetical protein